MAALNIKDEQATRQQLPLEKVLLVYPAPSDGTAAILATANAQGVVWILTQHTREIGKKVIKEIIVLRPITSVYFSCVFVLADHPSVGGNPPMHGADSPKRHKKRSAAEPESGRHDSGIEEGGELSLTLFEESNKLDERDTGPPTTEPEMLDKETCNEVVDKGEAVAYFTETPERRAEQSSWTSTDAFHQFGWVQQHRHNTVDPLITASSELRVLFKRNNIPREQGSLIEWKHEHEVERLDKQGSFYTPTFGYFNNYFYPSAIVALDQYSPTATGRLQANDVMPLKHWSDVAFLSYKLFYQQQAIAESGEVDTAKLDACLKSLKLIVKKSKSSITQPLPFKKEYLPAP